MEIMPENDQPNIPESDSAWARKVFDKAVRELIANNLIDIEVFEARPSWTMANQIVIGQVREVNSSTIFSWVICGDLPTDHINSDVAATPRDAARHFSLKWQLDATRLTEPSASERLIQKAELLYELSESENIWQ
jgi:hypothetical protein